MTYISRIDGDLRQKSSPLLLCDRFLRLTEETDRARFQIAAEQLVYLAVQMLSDAETPVA